MRVHEFAKQLTAELGKEVKSSHIIDILSSKKEGLKAQSSIDESMMKFVLATADTSFRKNGHKKQISPSMKKAPTILICTLFTGQPVRRVFLCVIVMSLN